MWEPDSLPAAGRAGFFPWVEQDMEGGLFCGRVCGTPLGDEYEGLRREMTAHGDKNKDGLANYYET